MGCGSCARAGPLWVWRVVLMCGWVSRRPGAGPGAQSRAARQRDTQEQAGSGSGRQAQAQAKAQTGERTMEGEASRGPQRQRDGERGDPKDGLLDPLLSYAHTPEARSLGVGNRTRGRGNGETALCDSVWVVDEALVVWRRGIEENESTRAGEEGYDDGVAQPRNMNLGSVEKLKCARRR